MIPALSAPSKRIAVAIAVSLLLHSWIMWGSNIRLPQFKSGLPPMVARLEPLPTAPAKPKQEIKRQAHPVAAPKPKPQEIPPAPVTEKSPDTVAPIAKEFAASAVAAAAPMVQPSTEMVNRPLLPHRAQLSFDVYQGTSNFKVGETVHTLKVEDGHYMLQSVTETTGLAKLFKTFRLTQTSSGNYTPQFGLQPQRFTEERAEWNSTQSSSAEFDYQAQRTRYSQGNEMALPPDLQDILSVLYQFPPLEHTEIVSVFVSTGKKTENYQFEIANNETIDTPFGKLLTVHLRKMHSPDKEGLEIWLAREYRLFPVKMRIIETNGEVSGEIIITDIRVEDAPQENIENATH